MRTITVVTATRAEYGLLRPVVQKIAASDVLDLQLVVTGAHLCPRLGETVHEIEADGLPIAARLPIFTDNAGRDKSPPTTGKRVVVKAVGGGVPDAPAAWGAFCAGQARERSLPIRGGGRGAGRKGSAR